MPEATAARNVWSLKLPLGRFTEPPTAFVAIAARDSATSSPVPKPMMFSVPAPCLAALLLCALARPAVSAAATITASTDSAAKRLRQPFMHLLRLEFGPWEAKDVQT